MKFYAQFCLLMWKNFVLQRRTPLMTFVEIALPVVSIGLLMGMRNFVRSVQYRPAKNYSFVVPTYQRGKGIVTYKFVPNTSLAREIMTQVVARLVDDDVIHNFSPVLLESYNTEKELEECYSLDRIRSQVVHCTTDFSMRSSSRFHQFQWLAVVFEGLGTNTSLPPHVKYVIRPKLLHFWSYSDKPFKYNFLEGPGTPHNGSIKNLDFVEWLRLQNAIGKTLINMWSKKNWTLDLGTRMLPFPAVHADLVLDVLQRHLPLFFINTFIVSVFHTTRSIVQEKERKLKESMKLMGMLPSAYWMSWFFTYFLYLTVVMAAFTGMMTTAVFKVPILREVDQSLLFVFLWCYAAAIVSYSIMMSTLFDRANLAALVSGMAFFMSYVPSTFLSLERNYVNKMLFGLLFNTAFSMGILATSRKYYQGNVGIQWSNFARPTYPDSIAVRDCMVMMVVDTVLHLIIAWYMDAVFPGEFGVPQSLLFFLKKDYWCGEAKSQHSDEHDTTEPGDQQYFQRDPQNRTLGIEICNLRKEFPGKVAVQGLSLKMYAGDITVMLGHNGAGKSTTMFMLTGFFPPTSGTAFVNGYNIRTQIHRVRESLGLCPQHNILFDLLTVEQNLYLFAKLKGFPSADMADEVEDMLRQTGLINKRWKSAGTLSGGMKRRLSVGIALIAGSQQQPSQQLNNVTFGQRPALSLRQVVILDEPTSGVDPSARRQMWALLQKNRKGRTILISTHFMDEADALGSRVAILAKGRLVCRGSPLFLKKAYNQRRQSQKMAVGSSQLPETTRQLPCMFRQPRRIHSCCCFDEIQRVVPEPRFDRRGNFYFET